MEADWEVEVGGGAPVIDAQWAGFIDLRLEPERATTMPEVSSLPILAQVLARLNAPASPVWTAKSDVWEQENFDPEEMEASPEESLCAVASYIDLLPRADRAWRVPEQAVASCKALVATLRRVPLRGCRADLIVRLAWVTQDGPEHGITAYLTACGSTPEQARATLSTALTVFVEVMLAH